jgi:acetoin utilization protein AcuB
MIAKQLISDLIFPLDISDSGAAALGLMDEYHVTHLPIVNNLEFVGLISDTDIFNLNNFEEPVGNHPLSVNRVSVREEQHFYDVVRLFTEMNLTLLPVVNEKNGYLGSITLATLIREFSSISSIDSPGGIIILEVNDKDYVLTEIAQIIETNDAKLLSMYLTSYPDSTKLEVTLKLNRIDIAPVIQTFLRYNYTIKATYSEESDEDNMRERYDSLMKYLNV